MKAAVLAGIRKIEIRDVPLPRLTDDADVLLRTSRAGICGSDIHYFNSDRVGDQIVRTPAILGHECTAVVESIGKQVKRLRPGDRVVVDPAVSCGTCDQCRTGRFHTCRHLRFLGYPGQKEGSLAEFFIIPEKNCFLLPGRMTMTEATLAEPLSIALYALQLWDGRPDHSIGILGSGPIGLCLLLGAKSCGIREIFMTDRIEDRVGAAVKAGTLWAGNTEKKDIVTEILGRRPEGLNAVFECCGDPAAVDQAVELMKPGGSLFILGIPHVARLSFDIGQLRRKEISIHNIRRQNRCLEKAIDMIADRRIDVNFLATHTFKLEEAQAAFETAAAYKDGVLKASIVFG